MRQENQKPGSPMRRLPERTVTACLCDGGNHPAERGKLACVGERCELPKHVD